MNRRLGCAAFLLVAPVLAYLIRDVLRSNWPPGAARGLGEPTPVRVQPVAAASAAASRQERLDGLRLMDTWPAGGAPPPPGTPIEELTYESAGGTSFGDADYKLVIHSDGTIFYDGEAHVKELGRRAATLTPAELDRLRQVLEGAAFWGLRDTDPRMEEDEDDERSLYEYSLSPFRRVHVSCTAGGSTKHVGYRVRDPASPGSVEAIEGAIRELTTSHGWSNSEAPLEPRPAPPHSGQTLRTRDFEWAPSSSGSTRSWPEAFSACSSLTLDGGGWWLPSKAELLALSRAAARSADVRTFPGITDGVFWSRSADTDTKAWSVDMARGLAVSRAATEQLRVRCVRISSLD